MKYQFKTKRLNVRPYKITDYETWRETFLNLGPAKNKWDKGTRDKKELTKKKFERILKTQNKNIKNDDFIDLIAFHKKTGAIIGFSSLMDISRGVFQNAYLGYRILNPYWREGYGKELIDATIDFSFKKLKLHRLEAGIHPRNIRSIALAKSLGLRREGMSKRRLFLNNKWEDMLIFAMTAEERGVNSISGQLRRGRR